MGVAVYLVALNHRGWATSLRRKTLLIVGITLAGLCAALFVIARSTVLHRFAELEKQEIHQNLDRVANAITNESDLLTATTRDDAMWDEAYHFVQHPNGTWGDLNFPPETLLALRLNLLIYYDGQDHAVHAREFDPKLRRVSPARAAIVSQLAPLARDARQNGTTGKSGVVVLDDGAMLVSVWPVLSSPGSGPPHGALLMGRRIDPAEFARLAWATDVHFALYQLGGELPEEAARAYRHLAHHNGVYISPIASGSIAAYTILPDISGRPALLLDVRTPRAIYGEGKALVLYLTGAMLFVGAAFTLLSLLLLESQILSRLIGLSRNLAAIGLRNGLSERVKVEGTDEISRLASSINQMLATLDRAERERQVPEAYLEGLFENAPEAVAIVDSENRIVRINAEFVRMFGYGLEEIRGRVLDRLIVPAAKVEEARSITASLERGERVSVETVRKTKDGSIVEVSILGTPVNVGGDRRAFFGIYRDIGERKRAERLQSALYGIAEKASSAADLKDLFTTIHAILKELMYAENCYVALYDEATDTVSFPYFVDSMDRVAPPPHKFRKGLTEYVLRTGKPLLATPEILNDLVQRGEVEQRTGAPSRDWMGVPLKQGETTFGVLTVQTYEADIRYGDAQKEILTFVSQQVASAILHWRSQAAIRESENRFRTLAEHATPAIYIYAARFYYLNASTAQLFGYSREELMAMEDPWSVLVHPDHCEMARSRSERRLRGEPAPSHYEFKIVRKGGEERWVDFSASTTPIAFAGKPANVAVVIDVTERKRAERLQTALYRIAATTSSAEDLHQLLTAIHGIVAELMYARNFYLALYDASQNLISFPYFVDEEDAPPASRPPQKGLTEYVLRTGEPLLATRDVFRRLTEAGEVEIIGADSLDWLGVPLKAGDTTFGALVIQSYTEKVRYTEHDKEILTFVSQHVASAIEHQRSQEALRDSENRYRTLVESAVYGIFRWNLDDRFTDVNPALVAMLGYLSAAEVLALRMTQDVYADPTQHRDVISTLVASGQLRGMEAQWRRKDDKIITVRLSGRSILEGEQTVGFEMFVEDITERRLLEDQLRQSQKMEAVGQLAGGVAHDFNNLLTVIKGNSQLLLERLDAGDPRRSGVEQIQKSADRAASLTGQLLAFSRKQVVAFRVLDLNAVLANMVQLLHRLLGEQIELSLPGKENLGRIKADPGQIEQVVMNLALNARDAMPNGGKLTIETANITLNGGYDAQHTMVEAGPYVELSVSDTGIGIPTEVLPHVFEPFFTTKPLGKGTGLGLSTVYGIVKQSNGYIWAFSEPGKGSSFKVYFPRVDQPVDVVQMPIETPAALQGTETVLLVEDEDGVRSLIQLLLKRNGYSVLEARSAEEALSHVESDSTPVHLLLTDLVLPRMGGRELAERVSAVRPGIKTLFMSGYTDDDVVKHGVLDSRAAFLQKPFSRETLLQKVREVLGRAAAAR